MLGILVSKSWTLETFKAVTAIIGNRVEVGACSNGFYDGFASSYKKLWCHLDDSCTANKLSLFSIGQDDFGAARFAWIYIVVIVRLDGVSITIVSNRGPQFTNWFQKRLQKASNTRLDFNITYHALTDGQSEHTIWDTRRYVESNHTRCWSLMESLSASPRVCV